MSQENVELWRASIEAEFSFRAGTSEFDPEATISKMAELWDPEMELDVSAFDGPDIGGRVYRGSEAVRRFWREWFAAWETLQVSFGKHAFVTTFRDGLMVNSKLYMSQSEALEAAGLSE